MHCMQILTREEIKTVLDDLKRKTYLSARQNMIFFRLSTCCGLRAKEICGLELDDLETGGSRPIIRIRKENTKGRCGPRIVPLWWDAGTLADIRSWKEARRKEHPKSNALVLTTSTGQRFHEDLAAQRWKTAIGSLGPERVNQLSIHCGRHTFCSHAILVRSIEEVRDAAGHADVKTTSHYLHVLERENVPDVFEFPEEGY